MSQFSKYFLVFATVILFASFANAQLFNRAGTIPLPAGPTNSETGFGNVISGVDFDGDGRVEIYAVNNNWNDDGDELVPKIYKYELNPATEEFEMVWTATLNIPLQNTWPALTYGDWDGDGKMEVIWGPVNFTDASANPNPARIVVFEEVGDGSDVMGVPDGSGGYKPNAQWTITSTNLFNLRPIKWQLVDIDGDGDLELVYGSRVTQAGPGNRFGVVSVSDIPDNGDGSEVWTLEASDEANVIPAGVIYDMTVMGNTLYLFHDGGSVTPVEYSGGSWTIHPTQAGLAGGGSWWSASTVDINEDGTEEILVASWGTTNRKVYLLQGSGASITSTEIADLAPLVGAGRIYSTAVGDVDNDGNMDFVFGSRDATPNAAITLMKYLGGDIASSASYETKLIDGGFATGGRWLIVNTADLNGDGKDDVIYGEGTGDKRPLVLLEAGAGSVTFQVDMGVQAFKGLFDPATDKVVIRGSFQKAAGDTADWAGDFFEMADADGDTIYTLTVLFPDSTEDKSYEHKFVISPDKWEGSPNRTFTVTSAPQTLPVVFFADDNSYVLPVTNTINFIADLNYMLGTGVGFFDPTIDSIEVRGLDWNGGTNVIGTRKMVNVNPLDAGEYTTTLTVTSTGSIGSTTEWKFKAYPDERFNNTGWETGDNRLYTFGEDGQTFTVGPIQPNITPAAAPLTRDLQIKFKVDVTGAANAYTGEPIPVDQIEFIGIKGELDTLGAWVGVWTIQDITDGNMLEMTNEGGNIWSITVTVPSGTPGGFKEYKYGAMYPGADTVNNGSSYLDNEAPMNVNHSILVEDTEGDYLETDDTWLTLTGVKRIDDITPTAYNLEQNYPNPFNPSTTIRYNLPQAGFVNLRVYNALGQEVAALVSQEQIAGVYEVSFDASMLSSGIYFYKLDSGKFSITKKMMLVK